MPIRAPRMGFGLDAIQTPPSFVAPPGKGSEAAAANNKLPILLGDAACSTLKIKNFGSKSRTCLT